MTLHLSWVPLRCAQPTTRDIIDRQSKVSSRSPVPPNLFAAKTPDKTAFPEGDTIPTPDNSKKRLVHCAADAQLLIELLVATTHTSTPDNSNDVADLDHPRPSTPRRATNAFELSKNACRPNRPGR